MKILRLLVIMADVKVNLLKVSAETLWRDSVLFKGTLRLSDVQYILASFFRFKGVICGYAVFMMAQRIMELCKVVKCFVSQQLNIPMIPNCSVNSTI